MIGTKGYSYLWLLLIVIIGAFFFAGGQFITEDLNSLGVQVTPAPTLGFSGVNPASPDADTAWNLTVHTTCVGSNKQTRAVFTVSAPSSSYPAYLVIQLEDEGSYKTDTVFNTTITSVSENDPTKTFNSAYSTSKWQAILYEGTSADASKKKAETGIKDPTNCP